MPSTHTLFTGHPTAMTIPARTVRTPATTIHPHPFSGRAPKPTVMRRAPAKMSEKARSSVRAVEASSGFTNARMPPAA